MLSRFSFGRILFTTAITTAFFVAGNVFAANPSITSFLLNGIESNTTFNPNNSESVTISIGTDIPVKFNTVAICLSSDVVCSRTTSVKYFTQTNIFSNSLLKEWDGKTGGSDSSLVAAGEYKIKATIKDELGIENTEFGQHSIIVDFSLTTSTTTQSTTTQATSTSQTPTTTPQTVTNTIIRYVSVHSSPEELSDYKDTQIFEIYAGRDRIGYAGAPIKFIAKNNSTNKTNCSSASYSWTYGDGTKDTGSNVSHTYKFPGEYVIVLNGVCGSEYAVSRAKVKILNPEVSIDLISSGDLQIYNIGKTEINMGDWVIKSASQKFVIPEDTIISAGGKIVFPKEYTKISLQESGSIDLFDPSNKLIFSFITKKEDNTNTFTSDSNGIFGINTTKEEVEKFATIFLNIISKKDQVNLAIIQNTDRVINKENIEPITPTSTNKLLQTASVVEAQAVSSPKGFWKNLLSLPGRGLKAIGRVFYDI